MRPLEKCRHALHLSLPSLERLLVDVSGGSKTTLSRLEQKDIKTVNKELMNALVEIFKGLGLKSDHIISPERYPNFCINVKDLIKTSLFTSSDKILNEAKIIIHITKQWFSVSCMSPREFAENVHKLLAEDCLVEWAPKTADKYAVWSSNVTRKIRRILEGDEKFPLSWKHYWLACCSDEVSQIVLSQILGKSGYMLVPIATYSDLEINETGAKIDEVNRYLSNVIHEYQPLMMKNDDDSVEARELRLFQSKLSRLFLNTVNATTAIQMSSGIKSQRELITRD